MGRGFSDEDLFSNYDPNEAPLPKAGHIPSSAYPKADLTSRSQFRAAVRHISNVHAATPEPVRQAGREWYPKVHDAVGKGIRRTGLSHKAGSAVVAALSPNMDFDRVNIPAFKEIHGMKADQWAAVHRSAQQPYGSIRTPEAQHALRGMSVSQVPDSNLVKAHRILEGEDPEEVIRRQTAPKTNSFMRNIHDPSSHEVTIDARAHDIAVNRQQPWKFTGRGISSAATKTGKVTRYEDFERAYRTAAKGVDEEHGSAMQAITWLGGKHVELSAPTKSGRPRVKGEPRRGQPYL